jgi:uncharacterized damage-inducible protein DinB
MKRTLACLSAFALLALCFPVVAAEQTPPSASPAEDALGLWSRITEMLVDMAEDFPEEKYDYQPTPEVRTFRQQLMHVAGANYFFIRLAGGEKTRPKHEGRKTKADAVAVLKESFDDGANLIRELGDAGMSRMVKHPFEDRMVSLQTIWAVAASHAGEHFGQLVVYYRLNGLVPPTTRKQEQQQQQEEQQSQR